MKLDGDRIRRLRENAGLTQQDLADAAQISKSYLSMIESGQRSSSSPPVAARLAQRLGVAVVKLRK